MNWQKMAKLEPKLSENHLCSIGLRYMLLKNNEISYSDYLDYIDYVFNIYW